MAIDLTHDLMADTRQAPSTGEDRRQHHVALRALENERFIATQQFADQR